MAALITQEESVSSSSSVSYATSRFSASASVSAGCTHQVFLSFRGCDTRNGFVGHLDAKLKSKGIHAFKDDRNLEKGKRITPEIIKAIRRSRISLVILSENFADSTYCLEELETIIECTETTGHIVVPIFYRIDTATLDSQDGAFAEAFAKHEAEAEFKEQVGGWRKAFCEVVSMSGWDSGLYREEAAFIECIVRDVSDKLCASPYDVGDLVGIRFQVEKMLKLLSTRPKDVCMVGIWGMPGIGKTTLAKVVYDRIFREFGGCCFLADVKNKFKTHGVAALRKELLSDILNERDLSRWPLDEGSGVIKDRLSRSKVLIVLDNVDKSEQLQGLAKETSWFGPGSRIIITTGDKQLLKSHGVTTVHEVKPLPSDQALQLFSRHAFKQDEPLPEYWKLSNEFVSYAKRVPLALKVLGSSLNGRTTVEWKRELSKLKKSPNSEIHKVLRTSFDALEDTDQDVFLDVACLFNGMDKHVVEHILDACGFFADRAFGILKDKGLLSFPSNKLYVHELLQQMACEVVLQQSRKEIGMRSRLWNPHDIRRLLRSARKANKVEGIVLDMSDIRDMQISHKAFKKMYNLRVLKIHDSQTSEPACKLRLTDEGLQSLSDELRYLDWPRYSLPSLPSNFCPENLVELLLPYSNIRQLWTGTQHLPKLRQLDLSHCIRLTILPDVSRAEKLVTLSLPGCIHLVDVSSIQSLTKLKYLNLRGCRSLRILPSMRAMKHLRILDLSDCSNLKKLPELPTNSRPEKLNIVGCQMLHRKAILCKLFELQKEYLTLVVLSYFALNLRGLQGFFSNKIIIFLFILCHFIIICLVFL